MKLENPYIEALFQHENLGMLEYRPDVRFRMSRMLEYRPYVRPREQRPPKSQDATSKASCLALRFHFQA